MNQRVIANCIQQTSHKYNKEHHIRSRDTRACDISIDNQLSQYNYLCKTFHSLMLAGEDRSGERQIK